MAAGVFAAPARAAREAAGRLGGNARSHQVSVLLHALMAAPPDRRRATLRECCDARELQFLLAESMRELGTPFALWHDTPSGFVEDVLGETVWSTQREILDAVPKYRRVLVPAGFGVGKCVYCEDVIPLADGKMVKAKNLVGQTFEVMSWRPDGTQERRAARAAWNAVEPVYQVTTVSGRTVTRNAAHPLWAANAVSTVKGGHARGTVSLVPEVLGWTPVGSLREGDLVLVPERHHAQGSSPIDPDHAKILGYLLGDGGMSSESQVTFTKAPGPVLDEFSNLAGKIGCDLAPMGRPHHYRVRALPGTPQRPNPNSPSGVSKWSPIVDLVNEWGLRGKLSKEKELPDWAWQLPNDQLALVMGRLFACDAWVYHATPTTANGKGTRIAAHVAICLASERLVRDIEAAMLRLGVWGNVRKRTVTCEGKRYPAWEWACRDRQALVRLAEVLDMPGKNDKLRLCVEAIEARGTARTAKWPHRNAPAGYRWDKVKEVVRLPDAQTVAIEVDQEHTFVSSMVEHNTHLAARSVLHHVMTRPVGGALAVTTATRFRQVRYQLWPHIRKAHARAGLPGACDTTQLKLTDPNGVETVVAYGFTAPDNDEAAMQGVHSSGGLLLVVDEAGGISKIIGSGTNNLLTGDARMLAIGNPAMDEPRSWFERVCEEGEDPEKEGSITIRIPATDSPSITGEDTPVCRECVPNLDGHTISRHVVDQDWVDRTIEDFGPDHPYVVAKVHAQFPRGGAGLALPVTWVESAMQAPDPVGPDYVRLCDLGLAGETEKFTVRKGSWVRLGVDVAGSGGDEFTVYRVIGDVVHKRHASAGPDNADQVKVAEQVKAEILAAQRLAVALGSPYPVRVKIDQNGIGHGATSMLHRWASTGQYGAQIVGVMVSESPEHDYSDIPQRPKLKRDEGWLAARQLLKPDPSTGCGQLRLRVDQKAFVQLSTVRMATDAAGRAVVESKKAMRKRGMDSPDRADGVILGLYEPFPLVARATRGILGGG